jgi:small GTP-binding protein
MSLVDEAQRIREAMQVEDNLFVAIALFGQPGAGKSSLINRLLGQKVAPEGVRNDTTTERKDYEWNGLTLVDLPGFDTALFPAETYLDRFRVMEFDLLLCVFDGKFHAADTALFREASRRGKECLFVSNKHDTLWQADKQVAELEQEIRDNVRDQVGSPQPVYFTSCRHNTGLAELETAVKNRLDPAKQDRWVRAAKAYTTDFLADKKSVCQRRVFRSAAISAVGGAIPIPGANIVVDGTVLVSLFKYIRDAYGLTDSVLATKARTIPTLAPVANGIIKYATTDGVVLLLKQFVEKVTAEQISKFIPFVGPIIAGSLGFAITRQAGLAYLDDCHKFAEGVLDQQLHRG